MNINLIVAMGRKRQIGLDGRMPWHIKEELAHFKRTTTGHTLIMGRKTWQAIGRPLPNRTSIVLTRDPNFKVSAAKVLIARNKEEALEQSLNAGASEIFICGGGEVYRQFLEDADKIYLSWIDFDGKADAFFPSFEHLEWREISHQQFNGWSLQILRREANFV